MKRNIILIAIGIIIVGSCDGADLQRILRLKRAESDFILRSCMASAQLTRKHRTNDPAQLLAKSSNVPKIPSVSLVLDNSNFKLFNSKNLKNDLRISSKSKGRYLNDKSVTDTPLGTVDVKAIRKDIPKVFKKKDPLPELDRNGSARNLDTDAPIIIVKPLHH